MIRSNFDVFFFKTQSESITKAQPLEKKAITPSSSSKVHDKSLRRSSSCDPYSMIMKKNHNVCPKESDSSVMGLAKRPAAENGGSAVKLSGFDDLLKKRMALANVNNASGKKNSGKSPPSSIRIKDKNLVITSPWSIYSFTIYFPSTISDSFFSDSC